MNTTVTIAPNMRRRRAVRKIEHLLEKNDAVSQHTGRTIVNLYDQSQSGQIPASITFALKFIPDSRSPKEIKKSFEALTQAILNLLQDLFCISGTCAVGSYTIDMKNRIESCVFRFDPAPISEASPI